MDYSERQLLRNRKMNFAVSMPISLVEVIDRIADAEQIAASQVILRALRKGLAIERDERAAQTVAPTPEKPKRVYRAGEHWTQRPENREKVALITRLAQAARKHNAA